jgi:hypothetical protein
MSEVEVITQHLHGSCVTINNHIHGLFRPTGRRPLFPDLRAKAAPPRTSTEPVPPATRSGAASA